MAEFPYLPFWTDAYLADTTHLTAEEHGAYFLLLMAAWRRRDTALPDDDVLLAKIARLSIRRWKAIKPTVMTFWELSNSDMKFRQFRLTREKEKVSQTSALQRARALKRNDNGSAAAQPRQSRGNPAAVPSTPISKEETQSLVPTGETLSRRKRESYTHNSPAPNGAGAHANGGSAYRFDDWWACWTLPGSKRAKAAAERKYRAVIKAEAARHDELCAGVNRYMAWCREEHVEVRYIKQPDTWLSKGCWSDDLTAARTRLAVVDPVSGMRWPA